MGNRSRLKNLFQLDNFCVFFARECCQMLFIFLMLIIQQVEGDIVELESLMRANFLVVDDEVAVDEVQGDEVQGDEVQGGEAQLVVADEVQQDSAEGEGGPQ